MRSILIYRKTIAHLPGRFYNMAEPLSDGFTLPALQEHLDELRAGEVVYIKQADFNRLFGVNDAALGRLKNFAAGHDCMAIWTRYGLQFQKQQGPAKAVRSRPAPQRG
jgi:hypothetical protein